MGFGGHPLTEDEDEIADEVVLEDTTELVIVDDNAELVIEEELLVNDAELLLLDDDDVVENAELKLLDEDTLEEVAIDEEKVDDLTELVNEDETAELVLELLNTEDSVDEDILLLVRLDVVLIIHDETREADVEKLPHGALLGLGQLPWDSVSQSPPSAYAPAGSERYAAAGYASEGRPSLP